MLPGPDEMWVRDGRGRYATEFLVHLNGGGTTSPDAPRAIFGRYGPDDAPSVL
jgi:hypothetical protein